MHKPRLDTLEVLACAPNGAVRAATPLLFLHGAYTAAWCWQEHFLPFFAAAGFACHALSFSGHGASRRREQLDSCSIDDYVNDVAEVVAQMPVPPVLIGHSMGGFVVQKYLEKHAAPAAVLMCSVPPQGLVASAFGMLFGGRTNLLSDLNSLMSGGQVALESLREALFAQPVAVADLARYHRLAQPESHRAIWDMTLFNLPHVAAVLEHLPKGGLLVQGAEHDMIISASLVEMTARSYGVTAKIFPGMGHGLMLEADWKRPAQHLIDWLKEKGSAMIVTFKSAASADVIYFGDVAKRMMELMGKETTDQGIITVEQLPTAIAALKAAIAADKECHRQHLLDEEQKTETAANGDTRPFVSLTQRAAPLVALLEESLGEKKPVVWGV